MDRLTEQYVGLSFPGTNALDDVLNRLAAYASTGLTPEEIIAMKADNKRLHELVDTAQTLKKTPNKVFAKVMKVRKRNEF